ncbi:TetR/AcrR family transcriptional regulator [Nocardia sp. CA-136227]|uniref:TetR/AcrR family transcriptional regulator n=1 Tax=Nocardia sp. CA-136227 TaxID=3239979 RepID=UPI003D9793C4
MRTHGWSGTAPADDAEAVDRILAAARTAIERTGGEFTMAEIARDLGVTRQTVYRYFANADALLAATAMAEIGRFLDILADHLDPIADAAEAVVEGIAYTLECLPDDRYLSLLLNPGRAGNYSVSVTSDTAASLGRAILERMAVDWDAAGFDDARLDELVEYMLRIVQSFVVDPGRPPRLGTELRDYLTTWVAPALLPATTRP